MWKFTVKWPISDREPGRESKLTRQERSLATEALHDVYEALSDKIHEGIEHVDVWWREPCGGVGYNLVFCFKGGRCYDGKYTQSYHPIKNGEEKDRFVKGVVQNLVERIKRTVHEQRVGLEALEMVASELLAKPEYKDVHWISDRG